MLEERDDELGVEVLELHCEAEMPRRVDANSKNSLKPYACVSQVCTLAPRSIEAAREERP